MRPQARHFAPLDPGYARYFAAASGFASNGMPHTKSAGRALRRIAPPDNDKR
jgi:hypothetical protein